MLLTDLLSDIAARLWPNRYWEPNGPILGSVCPSEPDQIADHFFANRIKHSLEENLKTEALDLSSINKHGLATALKRQIAYTYGIASHYDHYSGEKAKQGWNRRYWRDADFVDAEKAVDAIFSKVIERIEYFAKQFSSRSNT